MEEFISAPTYMSIEMNCHNLISFYRQLRDTNKLEVFNYLVKCSSQPCEELFRRFRSMTTLNWTSINMSMNEVCQKTKRINVVFKKEKALSSKCECLFIFLSIYNIYFHFLVIFKKSSRADRDIDVQFKSDDDILDALFQAIERAKAVLLLLGVPIVKQSFEFKRVDSQLKIKMEENDDIEEQMIDEMLHENTLDGESSLVFNDHEQNGSSMTDLAIVRKYCGKYVENCSSNGKYSNIN